MRYCLFWAALILAGCADPATIPFDPAAAAFIHAHGEGAIEGHAFVANAQGGVVNAAGQRVFLIPASPYARQRFAELYHNGHATSVWMPDLYQIDPRYRDFVRTTVADSGGNFRFDALAPGSYIVSTQVSWQLETRLLPQGKRIYETVMITGNETAPTHVIVAGT